MRNWSANVKFSPFDGGEMGNQNRAGANKVDGGRKVW